MAKAYLSIEALGVTFRPGATPARCCAAYRSQVDQRRIRLDHRPFRLRQVHPAQRGRRASCRSTTGAVILDRKAAVEAPGPDRAVVFQNHSLLPWLTVYENVRLAVDKVFGRTKSRAERHDWTMHNLALVQMTHAADKQPGRDHRRHEAARRHRPRPGHGAQGAVCWTSRSARWTR